MDFIEIFVLGLGAALFGSFVIFLILWIWGIIFSYLHSKKIDPFLISIFAICLVAIFVALEVRPIECLPSSEPVDIRQAAYLPKAGNRAAPRIVTAYTSSPAETDSDPCIGASNQNLCSLYAEGTGICASNAYPFGTRLKVEGFGDCTVLDRMNSRYPERVDVYMGFDRPRALNWGVKQVNVMPL